ncbi:unnamed protein product [Cylicocyclus nassatus]|uniref:Uncharacterized protein n=1 Tax=Cylicocyclus nassatus TaxID=53992 RepID=A0AA36H740_CYLNA|nr:unnamed protein product [Cylicocyclus nassatus]
MKTSIPASQLKLPYGARMILGKTLTEMSNERRGALRFTCAIALLPSLFPLSAIMKYLRFEGKRVVFLRVSVIVRSSSGYAAGVMTST